jgi:hypothetical protein
MQLGGRWAGNTVACEGGMTDSSHCSSSTAFLVGAVVGGAIQGRGRLTIEPGRLILKPSWPLRRLSSVMQVIHTESPVIVLKARLVPPWFSTSVSLRDDDAYAHVVVPWHRSSLLGAIREAGFETREISTRFRLWPLSATACRIDRWPALSESTAGRVPAGRPGISGSGHDAAPGLAGHT